MLEKRMQLHECRQAIQKRTRYQPLLIDVIACPISPGPAREMEPHQSSDEHTPA